MLVGYLSQINLEMRYYSKDWSVYLYYWILLLLLLIMFSLSQRVINLYSDQFFYFGQSNFVIVIGQYVGQNLRWIANIPMLPVFVNIKQYSYRYRCCEIVNISIFQIFLHVRTRNLQNKNNLKKSECLTVIPRLTYESLEFYYSAIIFSY